MGAGNVSMIKRVTSGAAIPNTADRQGKTRLCRDMVRATETDEAGKRVSGISGGLAELWRLSRGLKEQEQAAPGYGVPGRGNSRCKGPEVRARMVCVRASQRAGGAGAERVLPTGRRAGAAVISSYGRGN